jgi:hypothetical protein
MGTRARLGPGCRIGLTLGGVRQETEAEVRYQDLIDDLLGRPGVTPPPGGSGFGRGAVRFQKKIFVMFVRGRLVLKLPAPRVDELVAAGEGVRFDANKGTPMREWFSLDPESGLPWLPLATEALEFAQATLAGVKSGAAQAGAKSR